MAVADTNKKPKSSLRLAADPPEAYGQSRAYGKSRSPNGVSSLPSRFDQLSHVLAADKIEKM